MGSLKREAIEEAFGETLVWERSDNIKKSHIDFVIPAGGIYSDKEEWPQIQDAMIDALVRLEKALSPHIPDLRSYLKSLDQNRDSL